jgi:hypothetical protein
MSLRLSKAAPLIRATLEEAAAALTRAVHALIQPAAR